MSSASHSQEPRVSVEYHGVEREPVVVIDQFYEAASDLYQRAQALSFRAIGPYYPGVQAPADARYLSSTRVLLENVLRDVFNVHAGVKLVECNYSLVTTPPEDLQPIQRLPHFDSTDPGRIALLHYLCDSDQGGTSFFRHRASGFETVNHARFADYQALLESEAKRDGLPPHRYFAGSNQAFELLKTHPATFNRALLYRGYNLHSGFLPPGIAFDDNPRTGRLTVNTFFDVK